MRTSVNRLKLNRKALLMNRFPCAVIFTTILPVVAGCQASSPDTEPLITSSLLEEMDDSWSAIEPAGETTCSDGSDFRFFVRVADPKELVVYFQGGGACWTGASCDLNGNPTYKPQADEHLQSASGINVEEGTMHGMMAFGHPENPFSDHSMVFVPYCTGDVHIGNKVTTYPVEATSENPAREVTVHHRGYVNAMAALDWTYRNFLSPDSIFVTGSSAGAIPSPLYARFLTEQYPEARVSVLGDAAGGYRNLLVSDLPHEAWGTLNALAHLPEFSEMTADSFSFESLYITSGLRHPGVTFARYDAAEDAVQRRFLALGGQQVEQLQPLLDANHADIKNQLDHYVSYVAPGDSHTILTRPDFYTLQVDGIAIRDWVKDLATGKIVQDVHCGDCADLSSGEQSAP